MVISIWNRVGHGDLQKYNDSFFLNVCSKNSLTGLQDLTLMFRTPKMTALDLVVRTLRSSSDQFPQIAERFTGLPLLEPFPVFSFSEV
ncbi:hypothetical protein NPIL_415451 [Nephila pilipes]|uniref:Uncharacterized protein n=1 Tax=Nephila pilipes TaxID=299642 RepID=A0A8X6IAN8_NEPPI|nr:hypothetical protein NPIL_415451 [Nephila pilipes]